MATPEENLPPEPEAAPQEESAQPDMRPQLTLADLFTTNPDTVVVVVPEGPTPEELAVAPDACTDPFCLEHNPPSQLDDYLRILNHELDERKFSLEEKRHRFEVAKYQSEQMSGLKSRGASHINEVTSRRLDITYAALNVYRAGMGHDYKPPTVEHMLEEFGMTWNKVYGLVHPNAMPDVPTRKESDDADGRAP